MFSYFRCFNEVNKISKDIQEINYDDLILDYIYLEQDVKLAKIIFVLVEDKTKLNRFIKLVKDLKEEDKKLTKLLIKFGFNETSEIDFRSKDNSLFYQCCWFRLKDYVDFLINKGLNIHITNFNEIINTILCSNMITQDHFELFKYFIDIPNFNEIQIDKYKLLDDILLFDEYKFVKYFLEKINICDLPIEEVLKTTLETTGLKKEIILYISENVKLSEEFNIFQF